MELWIWLIIEFVLLIILTQLNKEKNNKLLNIVTLIIAVSFIITLGAIIINYVFIKYVIPLSNKILKNPNLLIALLALIISITSLLYSKILFNQRIKIMKKFTVRDGENISYLLIQNDSNKNIEIINIFINDKKVNMVNATYNGDTVKVYETNVSGFRFFAFKSDTHFKLNVGSDLKIQYTNDNTEEIFQKINCKIEIIYKTMYKKIHKTIETDLGSFV
ncbi:MAG: hypothetical protein ACK5K7_03315 [Bacilli bacterium]